jgi:hypothetical protein
MAEFCIFSRKVFEELQKSYQVEPSMISSDYEESIRQAAKSVWPETKLVGCWFHYGQAIQRHAKSIPELAKEMKRNPVANRILMMYNRLALLPPEKVQEGLDFIQRRCREEKLTQVIH